MSKSRGAAIRWILLSTVPLMLAGAMIWNGIKSYRQNSRVLMFIEPEAKSFNEAVQAAGLIVIGRAVNVGETLLEATEDGWERPVLSPVIPDVPYTPYTDFRIEVMEVIYAEPGWRASEEILLRILGGSTVIMEPDIDHREDLLRGNGKPHVFFLRRSLSPYDPGTWRAVDSVHIFPLREGKIHPNTRSLRWNVATIKSPITVEDLKDRVRKVWAGIPPAPDGWGSPGLDPSETR